jgi:hypothetical protein
MKTPKRQCAHYSQREGFYCVRLLGHEGDHLSIDNRVLWEGTPGGPVFWQSEAARGQPPTSEQARREQARVQGYEGEACPSCNAMQMIRDGKCLKCLACGTSPGSCG